MPLFESLLTSFGTTGTGGFGCRNDSFASFSPAIQNTVTTFMILSGINYTFYFCILSRRIKDAFRIEEVRWYLFLIFASVGIESYLITLRPLLRKYQGRGCGVPFPGRCDHHHHRIFHCRLRHVACTLPDDSCDADVRRRMCGKHRRRYESIPAGDFIQNHPQRAFPDYPPPPPRSARSAWTDMS